MVEDELLIEDLNPATSPDGSFFIGAMKGGKTYALTVSQINSVLVMQTLGGDEDFAQSVADALDGKAGVEALDGKADKSTTETHSLTAKATPVDADEFRLADSAASWGFKRLSWANLKASIVAAIKPYINSGAMVSATSGTSIDFMSIPAGVKRVNVLFGGVSTNGTDPIILQIGDAGGFESTGYAGSYVNISTTAAAANPSSASGFGLSTPAAASATVHGKISLDLMDVSTNLWVVSGNLADSTGTRFHSAAGSKALSATLDRVRVTTSGSNTFDAGSINVTWEF
jgi:hypothetical protein